MSALPASHSCALLSGEGRRITKPYSQPFQQGVDIGYLDNGLCGGDRGLVVLAEPAGVLFSQLSVRSTTHRLGSFSHSCSLIFSERSAPMPKLSRTSETNVPRQPASAQNFSMGG